MAICFKNKIGYCKQLQLYIYVTLVCDDDQFDYKSCDKRHIEKVMDKQKQELKRKNLIFLNWS